MSFTVEQKIGRSTYATAAQTVTPGRLATADRIGDLSDYDRELYGTRFNLLASSGRMIDTSDQSSMRPYKLTDNFWHVPAYGMVFTVPSQLPGSENKVTSSGTTIADRGGLVCRSYGQSILIEFGMRQITLDGTGGLASAGSFIRSQLTHTGVPGWLAADLLYPSGVTAGDLIQLHVAFRSPGTYVSTPGYLFNWEIFEPDLINANP
tara:strand:- start:170 stop:790 length:621 start_codon:yes stop_codon:yes gene_type:complete